jgi:hypothetical protein
MDEKRPDLWVQLGLQSFLVDARITHCQAASHIQHAQRILGAAKKEAASKTAKFEQMAEETDATFVAFCLETHGGMVPQAAEFIRTIAHSVDDSSEWTPAEIATGLRIDIARAIQAGNKKAVYSGILNSSTDYSISQARPASPILPFAIAPPPEEHKRVANSASDSESENEDTNTQDFSELSLDLSSSEGDGDDEEDIEDENDGGQLQITVGYSEGDGDDEKDDDDNIEGQLQITVDYTSDNADSANPSDPDLSLEAVD